MHHIFPILEIQGCTCPLPPVSTETFSKNRYNIFHHNLGLVTQAGPTIPSDRQPATFWITSPLTVVTENSAAGSDGMGIWYIFANRVTGPSGNETGFFEEGEAFRTSILPCERNTVHSNVDTGLMFGHELLWDQVCFKIIMIWGCGSYSKLGGQNL